MKTNNAHSIYIIKTQLDTMVIDLTHLMVITELFSYKSDQYYSITLTNGESYDICNSFSPKEELINAWIKSKQI